ncbi:MAG: hypothetical protein QOD75_2244 [Blastocatellia bacterium]|nr:hypothetical protein [Blastocatellia bacterium]
MTPPITTHTSFRFALFCILALLAVQLFSASSAKVKLSLSDVPLVVQADGYCTLSPISPEVRANKSNLIVEGEVVSQHSFWDSQHRNIYTANLIDVYKVFKGTLSGSQITVITEGGTVGNRKQVVTPALELSEREMGVLFCEPTGIVDAQDGGDTTRSYLAYGSPQGFIRYDVSSHTASEPFQTYSGIETDVYNSITRITGVPPRVVTENHALELSYKKQSHNFTPAAAAVTFFPGIITAGTAQVLTISGSSFGPTQGGGFVEFSNSDDGGATFMRPLATDYVSWSNTEIKVKVPSKGSTTGCAGTGVVRVTDSAGNAATSAAALTITYAYTNINDSGTAAQPDHVNDNGAGGYTFQMESAEFSANAAANAAFLRAMNTWTCATHINWTVGAPTATDTIGLDGVNVVRFDNGGELPVNVAGRASSFYSGCSTGGPFVWQVDEIDVVFDDATAWQFGPAAPSVAQIDFESVALHEIGHLHQLSHINQPGGVMHYIIASGQSQRVLSVNNDVAGGQFIMSRSLVANTCGTGPMTSANGTACAPTAADSSVSGVITDVTGQPLSGVALTLSGGSSARTITDSRGRYQFSNVDIGGFYSVVPSRANYVFTPSIRSFSLLGNHADALFTGAALNVESSNPLDTDIFFVRQQYVDILGREPDSGGLTYWTNELEKCGTDEGCLESRRIGIAAAFFVEEEFQQTGAFIYGLYKGALGRQPRYAEYYADRPRLVLGANLETTKQSFAESFVQRAEFVARYQTNTAAGSFVDALIQNVQQSSGIDLSGLRGDLISKYNAGTNLNQSRSLVLRNVTETAAFRNEAYNPAFVLTEYFGYLRRDPDPGGYDFWLDVLNHREPGNYRGMVCSFITSTEYQTRFSSAVTHGNAECGR